MHVTRVSILYLNLGDLGRVGCDTKEIGVLWLAVLNIHEVDVHRWIVMRLSDWTS